MAIVAGLKGKEKDCDLSTVLIGQVFRFKSLSFEEAIQEGTFFMRVNPNNGEKRIAVISIDGREQRLFDGEHRVIVHQHDTVVFPAAL